MKLLWRVVAHYYGEEISSSTWSFMTENPSSGCNTGPEPAVPLLAGTDVPVAKEVQVEPVFELINRKTIS